MVRRCPLLLTLAASLSLLGLGACRSGTSLDVETESAATSGTSGSTTASTEDTTTGMEPQGPVVCEPRCEPRLVSTWTHEGEVGDQVAAAMVQAPDGSITVAVGRAAGDLRLVRLSAEGETQWSIAPQLPCTVCMPVDLAVHPSGDLLLSSSAPRSIDSPSAVLARLSSDGSGLVWTRQFVLFSGAIGVSRSGRLAVLDDDRIVLLHLEGFSDSELLMLREVDGDGITVTRRNVIVQQGNASPLPLLAAAGPQGDLVLAYPWWNGEEDPDDPRLEALTSRYLPPAYERVSQVELPVPLDDLAIDSIGRRLELARSPGEQTSTLLLTSRSAADLERWSSTLPLVTTSSTRAALALGPRDEVYVAARTTPRAADDPYFVVELSVTRWSADGELQWQASTPLDMLATDDPLELLVDEDGGLVVATVVQGRLRVIRYAQECACE